MLQNGRLDGWHFTESFPSRAMTKPSSGLPREKRMSWTADKPAGQTRNRKGTVKTNPNIQTAPLPPIKGFLDIWYRICDVAAVGSATGGTLLTPSPIILSRWHCQDGIAMSATASWCTSTGFPRARPPPGVLARAFLSACES